MQNSILRLGKYGIGLIKPSQISQTTEMMANQFSHTESILYRMSKDDVFATFSQLFNRYSDSTSVIYDSSTGNILACNLGCDLMDDSIDESVYPVSLSPIDSLMEIIKPLYLQKIGLPPDYSRQNQIFFQIFTAVKPEAARKGLAQRVLSHSIALAKLKGFSHIRGDMTSQKSYSMSLKVGYEKLFHMDYKDMEVSYIGEQGQQIQKDKYWEKVPSLLKEERLQICNIFLDKFQVTLSRGEGNAMQAGIDGRQSILETPKKDDTVFS